MQKTKFISQTNRKIPIQIYSIASNRSSSQPLSLLLILPLLYTHTHARTHNGPVSTLVISPVADESVKSAYPATMKFAFRYHIQKLCSSLHCVDSLLMYLNSPAMHDGSTLLWDINGDGMVRNLTYLYCKNQKTFFFLKCATDHFMFSNTILVIHKK